MRSDNWLKLKFEEIWREHFSDVEKKNNVVVKFKGRWKNKFGHIKKLKNKNTEIVVNFLFKNEEVPEYIIELTIAHELVHYMHGFNSPHKKMFKYPHQGGVVRKELVKRGFRDILRKEKEFFRKEWQDLFRELK